MVPAESGSIVRAGGGNRFSRRSLLAGVAGLAALPAKKAGAQATPVSDVGVRLPRVSLPQWPAREADLYGPAATVPWARLLSTSTLLTVDAAGAIGGCLSLRPLLTPNRLEMTLELRPDALFADGTLVTVEDVIASLNRAWAVGMRGAEAWRWRQLTAIVRAGERQISLMLQEPDASIPALLASWRCPVLPEAWLDAVEFTPDPGIPASSGLFQLQTATADRIDYVRNDGYFQVGRPRLAGLTCLAPTSLLSRGTDLVTGSVDLLIDLPLLDVPMTRENPECALVGGPSKRLTLLYLNLANPPLSDRRFRTLLSNSVNREAVLNVAIAGEGRPATTLIPPDDWAGLDIPATISDPAEIRTELETLGYLPGIELRLVAPIGDASLANACVTLQEQLAWAGFALALDLLDDGEMERELREGQWDLMIRTLPWWTDPHELIWPLLTTRGTSNLGGFHSSRIDYLAAMACRARGEAERTRLYQSIQQEVVRDVPLIPLYFGNYFDAMSTAWGDYLAYPPESAAAMARARFL